MVKLYGTIQELYELDKRLLKASVAEFNTNAVRYTDVKEDSNGLFITLNPLDAIAPLTFLSVEQSQRLQPYIPIEAEP